MASLLSTAATAAGPVAFVAGFHAMRMRRLIEETPTSKIRSMAMGRVELVGHVEPRSRVIAPFSGRPCVWWEVEVQTGAASRDGRQTRWNTVHRNHSGHPFYLRDETGVALVYPQGAQVRLPWGVSEETRGLGVPDPYGEYMKANGLALGKIWALGPMRFRERSLESGTAVYVLGRATPRAQSMTVSWDEEALEATGTDAVGATRVRNDDAQVAGVVRRGEQDPAFLVSLQSEKTMAFEYGLKAFGGLAGGPALGLFGAWCLVELARTGQLFR